MRFYHYEGSVITGDFDCAQPDAIDCHGNVVKGVSTVQLPDDHPDVVVYRSPRPPTNTISGDKLADVLISKGILTQAEVDEAIEDDVDENHT